MAPAQEYTIDQLAQATGVTVRNIRAHQSRGLLPPPQVRGRTGFYGPEHVARLQLINEMQTDGFNLNSIKRILDGMRPGSAGEVLGLERALHAPWGEEQPEVVHGKDLAAIVGVNGDEASLRKAVKLGLVTPLGEDRFEVRSPTLLRAGAELNKLGVSLESRLQTQEQLKRHVDAVAAAYVKLFLDAVWKPFDRAGQPAEDWPRIRGALERMKPLATEALVATFHVEMADAVDKAFGKVMLDQSRIAPPKSPRPSRPKSR